MLLYWIRGTTTLCLSPPPSWPWLLVEYSHLYYNSQGLDKLKLESSPDLTLLEDVLYLISSLQVGVS